MSVSVPLSHLRFKGTDTSVNVTANLLYAVAEFPQIEEKILAEIRSLVGKERNRDRDRVRARDRDRDRCGDRDRARDIDRDSD
jgi:hypothetical protein